MGEILSDAFTLDISSEGKTLSSGHVNDHSILHALLNTPIRLDNKKQWYAKLDSMEVSKHVDVVICAPHVTKEIALRVGKLHQSPHEIPLDTRDKMSVSWIGETHVSFDFSINDQFISTPSLTSAKSIVHFLEYTTSYNRVKLLNDQYLSSNSGVSSSEENKVHSVDNFLYGIRHTFSDKIYNASDPPTHVYNPPTVKITPKEPKLFMKDRDRKKHLNEIEKTQPWTHVKNFVKKKDLPERYFSLTEVLEVTSTDEKLNFRVIPDNPYGVNYVVIRAPAELSYMFGFPYEIFIYDKSSCDPWYLSEGSEKCRVKACGVYGNTRPWDIWNDENIKIEHFSEICNPLYEISNVKIVTDFTELPLTESKPIIYDVPLSAWITEPATKYFDVCVKKICTPVWRRVISFGDSSINTVKLSLESSSGYKLRIIGKNKATRITILFQPM